MNSVIARQLKVSGLGIHAHHKLTQGVSHCIDENRGCPLPRSAQADRTFRSGRVHDRATLGDLQLPGRDHPPGGTTGGLHELEPHLTADRARDVGRADRGIRCPGRQQTLDGALQLSVGVVDAVPSARVGAVPHVHPVAGPRRPPGDAAAARSARALGGFGLLDVGCALSVGHRSILHSRSGEFLCFGKAAGRSMGVA